ncbi:MAG TPA: sulfurtransferase TusA family protein [Geobacterales bacterium]|nr:sulfurtransferase TusA family protein [Geobacterales bacterium]
MADETMQSVTIDTRGLSCPLPVLKVRKAMRSIENGTEVWVLATDPLADQDLRAYCEASGCAFLSVDKLDGDVLCIVIQKR